LILHHLAFVSHLFEMTIIHSDDSDERGDRFVVETDELGRSLIRFGNGVNGKQLPDGAIVHCTYQVAAGLDGNVGAATLLNFDEKCLSPSELLLESI
jgi:hypothetical protein